jgi:hypothetical protein
MIRFVSWIETLFFAQLISSAYERIRAHALNSFRWTFDTHNEPTAVLRYTPCRQLVFTSSFSSVALRSGGG